MLYSGTDPESYVTEYTKRKSLNPFKVLAPRLKAAHFPRQLSSEEEAT